MDFDSKYHKDFNLEKQMFGSGSGYSVSGKKKKKKKKPLTADRVIYGDAVEEIRFQRPRWTEIGIGSKVDEDDIDEDIPEVRPMPDVPDTPDTVEAVEIPPAFFLAGANITRTFDEQGRESKE
jgi:hypothetical protein